MSDFHYRLLQCCKNKGIKVSHLMDKLGISRSNSSNWGGGTIPQSDVIIQISELLDVSTDYLLKGKEYQIQNLPKDQQDLLGIFKELPEREKQRVYEYAKMLSDYITKNKTKPIRSRKRKIEMLPIRKYEYAAGAGFNTPAPEPDKFKIIELPKTFVSKGADSIFHILGDSMEPDYPDDCFVWAKSVTEGHVSDFYNQEIIAVNEGEALFKISEPNGLRSINSKYEIKYAGEDCRIIARVLKICDFKELLNYFE